MRPIRIWCVLLSCAALLSGCAGAGHVPRPSAAPAAERVGPAPLRARGGRAYDSSSTERFLDASFHAAQAEGNDRVKIDVSAVSDGYVAVSAVSDSRLKFQTLLGENTYTYNIASDGTPSVFPLQSGNGTYKFRVMENVVDTKYAELYSLSCDVVLSDPFQPFLRPSSYVNYSAGSACVKKAAALCADASAPLEEVAAIYRFVCATVTYDREKAATVKSGYLPDPDETMSTGKGICFDYAALAASMLRSRGIPTKMIFGYVSPDSLYHAWNMFYTEETGWVTVSYEIRGDGWNRLDLTFTANGADDSFVGNGENYADLYFY